MSKLHFLILILGMNAALAGESVQFNSRGQVIPPDELHLTRGLDHERDGFPDAAIKSFIKSSEFGNEHARFFVALLHMQQNNYIDALAWLYLVNAEKINREEKVQQLKAAAMNQLTDDQLLVAEELLISLEARHNPAQARLKRTLWRNGLTFTGTHLRGHVDPSVKVYANAQVVIGPDGQIEHMTATRVSAHQLKRDLEDFVINYRYDLPQGNVELHDIETEE